MLNIPKSKIIKKLLSGPYLDDDRYIKLSNNSIKKDCIVSAGFSGRNYEYLSKIAERMLDVRFVIIVYPDCLKDIKFTDNIEIVSGISELDYCRYIAKAKLFFLPIRNMETANGHLGIIQAMSLRTMLITNITKGTKDYLQPDINCIIYPDGNIEETINIIRQSLRDGVRRQYIEEKAYNFARRNFNVQKDINTLNDIINLLLNKRDNHHI
jgi:glycosyltransferase involved in cell wall biosynthesis